MLTPGWHHHPTSGFAVKVVSTGVEVYCDGEWQCHTTHQGVITACDYPPWAGPRARAILKARKQQAVTDLFAYLDPISEEDVE